MKLIKNSCSCHEICSRILESIHLCFYCFSFVFHFIVYYYLNVGIGKSSIWASDIYSSIADMITIVLKWLSYFSGYWTPFLMDGKNKESIYHLGSWSVLTFSFPILEFKIILSSLSLDCVNFFAFYSLLNQSLSIIIFSLHCS